MRPSNSAKMHPTLHTSIAVVYSAQLRRSSGARYHLVTTYSVMNASVSALARAKPKSQILRSQLALRRRLLGFKSRCKTPALCTYFNPRRSW